MEIEVIIKNNKTNSTVTYSAEEFEYISRSRTIKIYHSTLGNVTTRLQENEEMQINICQSQYDKYKHMLSECVNASHDLLDGAIFCHIHGCNLGCGDANCETCGYKEPYVTEQDIITVASNLNHGKYKLVNNKAYTQNGFVIEREVKCK